MSDRELLKAFEKYREKVGREKALSDLTGRGLSASTAERMANGIYSSRKPQRRTREALLRILGIAA